MTIDEQGIVLPEVGETSEKELRRAAKKDLNEWLAQSVVPEEKWTDIKEWIISSGLHEVYLEGNDVIGAWWAFHEAQKMGFDLNFTKASFMPGYWFPEGDSWKEAQANAKLKLVECWGELVQAGALTMNNK